MSSYHSSKLHAQHGFTLLEVLVALAILAISSLSVLSQTGQSVQQQQRLEQKTLAIIVAENQLTTFRVAAQWPDTGLSTETLEVEGQQWRVDSEITATSDPDLRKIEVTVRRDGAVEQEILASLIGYRGQF